MKKANHISTFQKLVLYYLGILLTGALLLMLPFSIKPGITPVTFIDALFTATSALCVTGLITLDTVSTWSWFGQLVIIVMIQIGGIGISALVITIFERLRRRENLRQTLLMKEDMNYLDQFQLRDRIRRMIKVSLLIELVGAAILFTQFIADYTILESLWYGLFHAISAFCNAGFDLIGNFSSLISYQQNPILLTTIMLLIVLGGLGYPVMEETFLYLTKKIKKVSVHVKVVLLMYFILVFGGALGLFLLEYNASFSGLSVFDKIINSFFMAITPRTAGFTSVDLTLLTPGSQMLSVFLMFIGGAPASTAGGLKVTTLFIMFAGVHAYLREKHDVNVFGRRINKRNVTKSYITFMMYVIMINLALFILSISDADVSFMALVFEAVSAIATVGSSLSITPLLSSVGKLVIMSLMFFGRLGAVTIGIALFKTPDDEEKIRYPASDIIIG